MQKPTKKYFNNRNQQFMEPKKKIILYHLGKINKPIANFDSNIGEAKLCVDLLNRHLLSESGEVTSLLDNKVLKRYPYYYLRGLNNKERAYYVGIKGLGNINDDPFFEKRILELTGEAGRPDKNPLPGGRKNSENFD